MHARKIQVRNGRLILDEATDLPDGAEVEVLVIDDEEMIRNFARSALERYGYRVLWAGDGQEGLRLFREKSHDVGLVLLDVNMPGMDGLETLDRMREIRPGVSVIVCSGFGDADVEARFARTNIAGFFSKPFTIRQLVGKIKECMPAAGTGE